MLQYANAGIVEEAVFVVLHLGFVVVFFLH